MRKLTIIVMAAIVVLLAVATAVAHYAANGERDDPVQKVEVPTATR